MMEHPVLRKSTHMLFIPVKDNNANKELSEATILRWICNIIVDTHAALYDSKYLIKIQAHKDHTVTNLMQLFSKLDLQCLC